ncbi:MAG: hypothetical protein FWC01_03005 [Treponema sp.]|nr:hypothetical protein [Treponema sp.]MCL2237028.1 hypothetical protein [Treponema sp.]
MSRFFGFSFIFLLIMPLFSAYSQQEQGNHPYVIRGEVYVDLEPIYAGHVDDEYPLDMTAASRRALQETAMFFSAMVYGWSFYYEVGERARGISESLELEELGTVQTGDPAMRVTNVEVRDSRLWIWADYQLNDHLQRRMQTWRSGMIRNAQGVGYAPSHVEEYPGWLALKKTALEDAARSSLRAMLRNSERNRPKEVRGFISLAAFPRFFIDSGRWAVAARFRVQITDIIPYAVY